MKSLMNRVAIVAGALMVAAGLASAQSMKAEIPFSFRAGDAVMPAGTYRVDRSDSRIGIPMFHLLNWDTKRSVLVVSQTHSVDLAKAGRERSDASLTFECGGAHCALIQIWTGSSDAYDFFRPKMDHDEDRYLTVIRLTAEKAE